MSWAEVGTGKNVHENTQLKHIFTLTNVLIKIPTFLIQ